MTRIVVQNLQPDTIYAYRVRARNGMVFSDWSPLQVFTTITDEVPPATPTGFTWVAVGNAFHGEWNAVTENVDGEDIMVVRYELELTANSIPKIVSVTPTTGDKVTYDLTYENNIALWGAPFPTVTARVRTVDNRDLKSDWTAIVSASNDIPSSPSNVVATGGLDNITITWDASTAIDVRAYNVHVGTTAGFTPTLANRIFHGDALRTTYQTSTYSTHYFKVSAEDEFGQLSAYATSNAAAPTSPAGADGTPPAQPTGISATITTDADAALTTYMDVSWTGVSDTDLAGYQVRYRKSTSGNYEYVNVDDTTTAVRIRGLEPYVNYTVSVQAYDFSANYSGFPANVTATGATNANPSQPAAPTVSSNTMQVQVTVTGNKQAGGAMESDVTYYEVYASDTTGFTPGTTNQIGTIPVGPAMIGTFPIPADGGGTTETWYVKIIAVDKGGLKSTASPQATSTPGLIQGVNIANATIGNAQIADLAANKITAGTGLINDLTIKSVLTIGDGSTSAYIRSFDWTSSGGTTGYEISKSGITVKTGSIAAPALQIQSGVNIVPPEWASFEGVGNLYTSTMNKTNAVVAVSTTTPRYGSNSITVTRDATTAVFNVYLGTSTTDYNIAVTGGVTYIISAYVRNRTAVTTTVRPQVKWSDGTFSAMGSYTTPTVSNSTWTRITFTATAPSAATGAVILFDSSTTTASARFEVDGVQMEEKISASTTPSAWSPSGVTTVTGNLIKTGAIQSTQTALVYDATTDTWVTDPSGRPSWYIDTTGAAYFGRANVTGNIVVGSTTDPDSAMANMQSSNYVKGSAGWTVRGDGYAEFRQMAADSIDGDAIRANTLDVDTIKNGDLNAAVNVRGSIIVTNPTTFAQVGMSAANGFFVYGPSPDGGLTQGPTYISFPVDGAPNIVSGTLKATTLEVQGSGTESSPGPAAAFFQNSTIQPKSKFTLIDVASSPTNPPAVSAGYNLKALNDTGLGTLVGSLQWHAPTSSYYGLYLSSGSYYIRLFNSSGANTSNVGPMTWPVQTSGGNTWQLYNVTLHGMVIAADANLYVLGNGSNAQAFGMSQEASGWFIARQSGASIVEFGQIAGPSGVGGYGNPFFGLIKDGTGFADFIVGFKNNSSPTDFNYTYKTYPSYTRNATNWRSFHYFQTPYVAAVGTWYTNTDLRAAGESAVPTITHALIGNYDFGSGNWKLIVSNPANSDNHFVFGSAVYGSTLTLDTNAIFSVGTAAVRGMTYPGSNSTFEGISAGTMSQVGGKRGIIQHSSINWGSGTTGRWGVATTRYDSINAYQSKASLVAYFNMVKRANLVVTADSGTANAARIYVGRKSTDTLDATTEMYYQSPAAGTGVTVNTFTAITFSGTTAPTTNTFPAAGVNGAQIVSETTDTLIDATTSASTIIRADGYVRMKAPIAYQMTLRRTTAQAATSGLETALRIGNPTGDHLRFGPTGVYAMSSDTSQGAFNVNHLSAPGSFQSFTGSWQGAFASIFATVTSTTGRSLSIVADGYLNIGISLSAFVTATGGTQSIVAYFDGTLVVSGNTASTPNSMGQFYFNNLNVHHTFPTVWFKVPVTAGTHYLEIRSSASTDSGDWANYIGFVLPN